MQKRNLNSKDSVTVFKDTIIDKERLLGRYSVLEELASTRFSTVYKAFDSKMQRLVAIKVIKSNSKATTWAKREAQLSAQLNHPNICTIYEYEETEKAHYLIMEYLEGLTLREILNNCDVLSLDEAVVIAKEVCNALEYAHLNHIIHKDIKPENILLLNDGRLKIMDFGTARLLGQIREKQNILIGTPAYMAPEQTRKDYLDDRTDQFSLAVVLYEMLAGSSPFEASTVNATIFKVQNSRVPSLTKINPQVNKDLEDVILKALSKKPDERFIACTNFRYKLERAYEPLESSKQVLATLVKRYSKVHRAEEDGSLSFGGALSDVVARIYLKNRCVIKSLLATLIISALGFIVFGSVSRSYDLVALLALAGISFFSKSYGLTGLAVLVLATMALKGLFLPALLLVAAIGFWYLILGKKNYFDVVFSLAASIFYFFNLQVLFPLFAGLAFSPIKAFIISFAASLQVLIFSSMLQHKPIMSAIMELSQLITWPFASVIISLALIKKTLSRAVVSSVISFSFLIAAYIVVGSMQNISFDFAMKSASLSLIITMVILPLIPYEYLESDV